MEASPLTGRTCMQRKVEGLVLSKMPYQDRHIIMKLLMRSGQVVHVLLYGGRGEASTRGEVISSLDICVVGWRVGDLPLMACWQEKNLKPLGSIRRFDTIIMPILSVAFFSKLSQNWPPRPPSRTGKMKEIVRAQVMKWLVFSAF